jgi:type 1 glutamine amidotransferase/regulation of enolase protein 1 (concanavalin A-like superfamily)
MTTVKADVDGGNKNFILQSADHTGADYVLETKLSAWTLSNGFEQAGILLYADDQNYVKFDAISDNNNTAINRIENRSKVNGTTIQPQPNLNVPAGVTAIWLRMTKSGTNYTAEASFDGSTWQMVGTAAVTNPMTAPKFGVFTAGVNSSGQTATFDYFKVNGSTGCSGGGGNTSPVITTATATPTAGFAPLNVAFNAAASDADNDTLSYSWDYNGDGTADATGASPSTTFTTAGTRNVKLTVSDGKGGTATKTIPVQVLGADDPNARFRALVFSKTTGFRHDAIEMGNDAIKQMGQQKNFQVDQTEDASLFTDAVLSHYDVVVFNSTTGDPLDAPSEKAAFQRYIEAGGGFAGIHAAADSGYDWHWYGQLVGGYFRNHPGGTPTATVVVEDTQDPSTAGLPARWTRTDEWYNYKKYDNSSGDDYSTRNTPGVHVLLKMDESTYTEEDGSDGTDDDHPIAWCQRYDGGRSWYTGLGHTMASYSEPLYLAHLEAGIEIAAGVLPDANCGVAPRTGTDVPVPVGGTVPSVLALDIGSVPSLGTFQPGVTRDYTASVGATVTSTATAAALSVRDTSTAATGRLVNGSAALPQALQVSASDAAHPTGAFAPLSTTGGALTLLAFPGPVASDQVTLGFKQPIAAADALLRGSYAKTLTFTLSATTP